MSNLDIFLEAIHNRRIISIIFDSFEKGEISRKCIPFDYGPSRRFKDGEDRFHAFTLNSPSGNHNISILPKQLIEIEMTNEKFNPGDYVTWEPNWIIKRDWGPYS